MIEEIDDQIAGVNVKVRYYYDDETKLYSFQTNPQLKDKDQIDYHNFGGGTSIDGNLANLKNKYNNTYKKEYTSVVDQRDNPVF